MRSALAPLVLVLALAVGVVLSPAARAEHLPDHRYFIVGTVTNEIGDLLCGVTVRAADIDKPTTENNRTAVTDASGYYHIQLHMHASFDVEANAPRSTHNELDHIRVSTVNASRVVTADKNTKNPNGWGQQTVDLPAQGVRGVCSPPLDLTKVGIGIAGVSGGVVGVVWIVRRPRRLDRGSRAGLRQLPGVGRSRARELEGFGIRRVEDLATTSADKLAAGTTLTPKQARLLVRRANEALGRKA